MSKNSIDQNYIVGLAYVLACKFLGNHLPGDANYWSTRFGSEALALLEDPNVSPDKIEELCAEVLNFGEKLN